MVSIASRASWGARFRDGDIGLSGLAAEVIFHHTVTATLPATATVAQERAQMQHLESIGQNRFGQGISYNLIIFPSGRAYQGVSWGRRGTHTGGRNSTARGIAFAGNFDQHQLSAQALATAAAIYRHGRGRWWRTDAPVRGHRDVSATACPGRHITGATLAQIRAGSTQSQPAPPPTPANPPLSGRVDVNVNLPLLDLRNAQNVSVSTPGVALLQGLLMAHRLGPDGLVGSTGRPTGVAGGRTREIFLQFQRNNNLTPDAICGPLSWRALLTPFQP